jgi:NAD(P)-dependent dehydrogenase (short-subunit alcohol dehydrogenase family)
MTELTSFAKPFSALVVGAGGGIGGALVGRLAGTDRVTRVHAWSRGEATGLPRSVAHERVDITDEATIEAAADHLGDDLRLVIVATGLLHDASAGLSPEKTWRDLDKHVLARSFAVNTIGPALIAKHVLGRFPRDERAIFAAISARVGSISDNRLGGWYGYRASKAALNQIIRTLAIELKRSRTEALCVGLHPGTVDTRLSEPFQANVPNEQLMAPDRSAGLMLGVLDRLGPGQSGQVFAHDGEAIAP